MSRKFIAILTASVASLSINCGVYGQDCTGKCVGSISEKIMRRNETKVNVEDKGNNYTSDGGDVTTEPWKPTGEALMTLTGGVELFSKHVRKWKGDFRRLLPKG